MSESSQYTNSIFQQPWWLDAVAPGQWSVAQVAEGGDVRARMPYVETSKYGLRGITMPKLTQTLGPWLASSGGKSAKRLKQEKEWLTALVDQLPPFDYFVQCWHYSVENWLPFFWRGFTCSTRYTFVLDDLSSLEDVARGFHENTRWEIKKARQQLNVRTDLGLDEFWPLNELTFARQGQRPPYTRQLVDRLDEACRQRDARKIFFAEDAKGHLHAALYLVWDQNAAYYLMSGSDPELRRSGAMSLLVQEAIAFASTVTRRFDFEGSMIEPIEHFVRNFGAQPKPYFLLRGYSRRMNVVDGFRSMFRKAAG
jgi:hypothetical protein